MQPKLQLWWWNLAGTALILREKGRAAESGGWIKKQSERKTERERERESDEEWLCPWVNIGFADIVFMNGATDKCGWWDSQFNLFTSLSKAILRVRDEKENTQIAGTLIIKMRMLHDSVCPQPFLVALWRICFLPLKNHEKPECSWHGFRERCVFFFFLSWCGKRKRRDFQSDLKCSLCEVSSWQKQRSGERH